MNTSALLSDLLLNIDPPSLLAGAMAAWWAIILPADIRQKEEFTRIDVPVLLVAGDRDDIRLDHMRRCILC